MLGTRARVEARVERRAREEIMVVGPQDLNCNKDRDYANK